MTDNNRKQKTLDNGRSQHKYKNLKDHIVSIVQSTVCLGSRQSLKSSLFPFEQLWRIILKSTLIKAVWLWLCVMYHTSTHPSCTQASMMDSDQFRCQILPLVQRCVKILHECHVLGNKIWCATNICRNHQRWRTDFKRYFARNPAHCCHNLTDTIWLGSANLYNERSCGRIQPLLAGHKGMSGW